jgi:putative membrane protein
MPLSRIALMAVVGASILLVVRALSMGWSFIRLYGFTLDRADHDLRAEFGLVTRVMATIPLHRIQTLTIREGPLHRFFGRVSIRVDSAGSAGGEGVTAKRESLAPIVSRHALPQLLHEVLPEVDLAKVEWQPVDPGGFRRALRGSLVMAAFLTVPLVLTLKWWTLVWMAMLVVWAWFNARQYVRNLGWALTDPAFATESDPQPAEDLRNGAVLFRSGWLWKHLTVARITKIQAVTLNESPFDRRSRMASVRVDTAGASDLSHRVDIPYLAASTATRLYSQLSSQAARTTFRW